MGNSVFLAERFTDRNLIESIVSSFFIVDYGFISAVNGDKTVNVQHAKRLVTTDGQTLPAMETKNIEVLTVSGGGFAINFDYAKGDKVLLLGLKDKVDKVNNVVTATANTSPIHYDRETLKALPLCVFNDNAKAVIKIENGNVDLTCSKFTVKGTAGTALEVTP